MLVPQCSYSSRLNFLGTRIFCKGYSGRWQSSQLWNRWYDERYVHYRLCYSTQCSHTSTRHPVISIKDVIPRCATIVVHVRCSLRGRDGSTEETQGLLHGVFCVSSCIKSGDHRSSNILIIYSVSLFGSYSQNGCFPFWLGFQLSVLQLPTMLPSRECLVAATVTRV